MTLYGWTHDANWSDGGRAEHVQLVPTEANFFSVFGVQPILGRTWIAGEDQSGKDQVAVLSCSFWRSHFAGDPDVAGRKVLLHSREYTIVGVMPPSFRYPSPSTQLWIPLDTESKKRFPRGSHWAQAVGRIKPGVTLKTARADIKLIAAQLEKAYPDSNDKVGADLVSLRDPAHP